MLIQRTLAALALIPCVVLSLLYLPQPVFMALVAVIIVLSAWEWSQFLNIKAFSKKLLFTVIMLIVLVFFYYLYFYLFDKLDTKIILSFALAWWLIAIFLVFTFPKSTALWNNYITKFITANLTLIPFAISFIELNFIQKNNNDQSSYNYLLYVMILVWITDSGAYFSGRAFGKHKLAPSVSPSKTIEGLLGGVLTAIVVSFIAYYLIFKEVNMQKFVISSIIAIFASVLGDLVESMFKREAKIKDSGNLIPGHGGILDRVDSLTAAIPMFTLFYLYIL